MEYKNKFKKRIKDERMFKDHWRKKWLPFIKYDQDFAGEYLLELIVYKLHLMLEFWEKYPSGVWLTDEEMEKKRQSLRKACELGDLLIEDNFDQESFDYLYDNSTRGKDGYGHECSDEVRKTFLKMNKEANETRQKIKQEFFKYIADNYESWSD